MGKVDDVEAGLRRMEQRLENALLTQGQAQETLRSELGTVRQEIGGLTERMGNMEARHEKMYAKIDNLLGYMSKLLGETGNDREKGILLTPKHSKCISNQPENIMFGNFETAAKGNASGSRPTWLGRYHLLKMEFPKFNGEDVTGWIIRSEWYFQLSAIHEEHKVMLAFIHFEGVAKDWFQYYVRTRPNATWPALVADLTARFAEVAHSNVIGTFNKLK